MKRIQILHKAQAVGGVDRYMRMFLKYLNKEKFKKVFEQRKVQESIGLFTRFP